jgi:predicted kinase
MLFAGIAGSGKTTLARILAKEFGADTLFVPCAWHGEQTAPTLTANNAGGTTNAGQRKL